MHKTLGTNVAVLARDYLLVKLRYVEIMKIMSGVIEHIVRGGVMQIRGVGGKGSGGGGGLVLVVVRGGRKQQNLNYRRKQRPRRR